MVCQGTYTPYVPSPGIIFWEFIYEEHVDDTDWTRPTDGPEMYNLKGDPSESLICSISVREV